MILSSVTLAPNLLAVVDETGGFSATGLPCGWPEAGMATAKAARATATWTVPRGGRAGCRCRQGFGMVNSRGSGSNLRGGRDEDRQRIVAEAGRSFARERN